MQLKCGLIYLWAHLRQLISKELVRIEVQLEQKIVDWL